MLFEFVSEGSNGNIHKVILYVRANQNAKMYYKDFYNFALGDKDLETGQISEYAITNNGDSIKILATVASTFYEFTEKYPDAWIYLSGANEVRTRLFRMAISNNLIKIEKDFEIYGLVDNLWLEFRKDVEYLAFLIIRKESHLNKENGIKNTEQY